MKLGRGAKKFFNKSKKISDSSPLHIWPADNGFNVYGNSDGYGIEGTIMSSNKLDNYLHAEVDGGVVSAFYNLRGEGDGKRTNDLIEFKSLIQDGVDNYGEKPPFWARRAADRTKLPPQQQQQATNTQQAVSTNSTQQAPERKTQSRRQQSRTRNRATSQQSKPQRRTKPQQRRVVNSNSAPASQQPVANTSNTSSEAALPAVNLNELQTADEIKASQSSSSIDSSNSINMDDVIDEADPLLNFKGENYEAIERNGRKYYVENGRVKYFDELDSAGEKITSEVNYSEDFKKMEGRSVYGASAIEDEIKDDIRAIRKEKINNMSTADWEDALTNHEKYGFTSNEEVLPSHLKNVQDNIKDIDDQIETLRGERTPEGKKKKTNNKEIEKLKKQKDKLLQQQVGLEYRQNLRKDSLGDARVEYKESQKKIVDDFKSSTQGTSKDSAAYKSAHKKMQQEMAELQDTMYGSAVRQNKNMAAGQIKGITGKGLTLGKIINVGFSAKAGIDKYKESRAEGSGVITSAIKGAGSVALGEILGPAGYMAYAAAEALPKLAVQGANSLYTETRRMNSSSNFMPLGGVNFQDTQQLATMRQSGMELAKMSQYNLEQTLMGAEAKHLHR